MKLIVRGFFALLLILVAVFGGVACTRGGPSEISKSDLDKLNAANATVRTPLEEFDWESSRCPSSLASSSKNKKCEAALLKKYVSETRAAASVYDQVAARAHGACQKALRKMASDIRGFAKSVNGGSKSVTADPSTKDRDAMLKACKLALEKSKK